MLYILGRLSSPATSGISTWLEVKRTDTASRLVGRHHDQGADDFPEQYNERHAILPERIDSTASSVPAVRYQRGYYGSHESIQHVLPLTVGVKEMSTLKH